MMLVDTIINSILGVLFPSIALKEPLASLYVCGTNIMNSTFLTYSLIALVGSAFFAIAIYMLSRILEDERQKAFAIGELQEFLSTIIIFLVVGALLALPCASYPDPITGFNLNSYDRAFYMLQSVEFTLSNIIIYLQVPYFFISLLNFSVGAFGVSVTSLQGIYGILKPLFTQNVTLLILAITMIKLLTLSFDMLTYGVLLYILPIGLFLRSFYLTRKVGGALIGMVIATAIIYPLVLGLFYPLEHLMRPAGIQTSPSGRSLMVDTTYFSNMVKEGANILPSQGDITPTDVLNVDQYLYNYEQENRGLADDFFGYSSNLASSGLIVGVMNKLAKLIGNNVWLKVALQTLAITGGLISNMGFILIALAYGFLFAFFFPVIVTLVISTAGRFVSSLLGQELDLGNLTRLV